jgi:RNA polymerase sigma-70 factor (ECF subfamily)
LHGNLLNLTRHYHRDRKRMVYDDELAELEPAPPDEYPSASDLEMTTGALTEALGSLSGPHREVLVLRFYEDMKLHEIAAHLGISKGTVKSRLHYAIAEMQSRLPSEVNLFGAHGTHQTAKR